MNPVTQPFSMMGAGMPEDADEQQLSSMLPSGMAMPLPQVQPPDINPGMAAGSGMLAALQGQAGNPYVQQQMQMQNQMFQAQAQQFKMLQQAQKMEIERRKEATRNAELPLKTAEMLDKINTPAASQIAAAERARYLKGVLKIDVDPRDLVAEKDLKEKDRDLIHSMLITMPPGSMDFSNIKAAFPNVPDRHLVAMKRALDDPMGRAAMGIKIDDPETMVLKLTAEKVTAFRKGNPQFDDDEIYAYAAEAFKTLTGQGNILRPGGRAIFTATDAEKTTMFPALLKYAQERKLQADIARKGQNLEQLAQRLADLTREGKGNSAEALMIRQQMNMVPGGIVPISAHGGQQAKGDLPLGPVTPQPAPAPVSGPLAPAVPGVTQPSGLPSPTGASKEPSISNDEAGGLGLPAYTSASDAKRIAQERGLVPKTAAQRQVIDNINASMAILDSIEKDLTGLSKIRSTKEMFTQAPGRFWDINLQNNPKANAAYTRMEGSLAKIARSLGEVGTLAEGDIDRARSLWPILTPKVQVGWPPVVMPDRDETVALKFKGLRELFTEIKNRTALPEGSKPFRGDVYQAITGGAQSTPQPQAGPLQAPAQQPPSDWRKKLKSSGFSDDEIEQYGKLKGLK